MGLLFRDHENIKFEFGDVYTAMDMPIELGVQ